MQRENQKEFKANHLEWFRHYLKFSKAMAKVLDPFNEIQPTANMRYV